MRLINHLHTSRTVLLLHNCIVIYYYSTTRMYYGEVEAHDDSKYFGLLGAARADFLI